MREAAIKIGRGVRAVWWWLRQVMGDASYDTYLRSATEPSFRVRRGGRGIPLPPANVQGASCCGNAPEGGRLLTREEFYLDALRRRYSGISRCC
jgi:uncharacterized short protein YbdD (DUF466 family)